MSTDDLAAAAAALEAARGGVADAQDKAAAIVAGARAEVERRRAELAETIVAAARRGVRQREIVKATGYSRERVRQILRASGVEPDDD